MLGQVRVRGREQRQKIKRKLKGDIPKSREELRSRGHSQVISPIRHKQTDTAEPSICPQSSQSSFCLHTPYECSIYRFPPEWCSMCKVRASTICAQNGAPDVRSLFIRPPCQPAILPYPPYPPPPCCPPSYRNDCRHPQLLVSPHQMVPPPAVACLVAQPSPCLPPSQNHCGQLVANVDASMCRI